MQLTRDNVLWFAGLFEGEGWFRFCPIGRRSMGIGINMTDRDVLEKAETMFGGWIWDGRRKEKPHHKQAYTWKLDKRDKAYALLVAVYPFLGERRKAQARKWADQYRQLTPVEVEQHGRSAYVRGCRCEICSGANNDYSRNWFRERAKAENSTTSII